ncbi:hypothetical protein RN001_015238 [Aquatica leii]|uniref:Uncharacterized protein n=1 Tax=Aquatica leii TaxID=1421715 RepID=A0AAN7SCR8_9COLE|nr:hypothetical protein RN001_015238 [Aquatica leii]
MDNFNIRCNHKVNQKFECEKLTKPDILKMRSSFYKDPNKTVQDNFLATLMNVKNPQRKRSRKDNGKNHEFSVFINKQKLQICQKLIKAIYSITQRSLNIISKKVMQGKRISEDRGGDTRSSKYLDKVNAVQSFIKNLKGKESHYGRQKSKRIYLSSEYNITTLWKLYNKSIDKDLQVNYKYFSNIFSNHFNIGFGNPATDVCSYCVRTETQISIAETNEGASRLKTELKVHKFRAKQFYKLLKELPPNTITFCCDLQQVQVLPNVPIQEAFYAQQLSCYFFCITTEDGITKPIFYSWMEHQAGRGAVEISSALLDHLKKIPFSPDIQHIRLFTDGCGGQNKNSHVVHMLMVWLLNFAPPTIETSQLTFPVRGHSYIPPDRVFGRVEKLLRSYSVIKTPETYWSLYTKTGEVRKLEIDWHLRDIKNACACLQKLKGISGCKRIILKKTKSPNRVLVKTEVLYRNDDETKRFETLLKPRKRLDQVQIPELPIGHKIKTKKLESLKKLLISLSGEDWNQDPELKLMEPLFTEEKIDEEDEASDADVDCECADTEHSHFL